MARNRASSQKHYSNTTGNIYPKGAGPVTDIQAWLDQVEARLDAVRREPAQEDREYDAEIRAWSDLYQHAPTDLARAHHIITRMVHVAENHPDPCSEHPEGDAITCGWKRAYKSVIWALKGQD